VISKAVALSRQALQPCREPKPTIQSPFSTILDFDFPGISISAQPFCLVSVQINRQFSVSIVPSIIELPTDKIRKTAKLKRGLPQFPRRICLLHPCRYTSSSSLFASPTPRRLETFSLVRAPKPELFPLCWLCCPHDSRCWSSAVEIRDVLQSPPPCTIFGPPCTFPTNRRLLALSHLVLLPVYHRADHWTKLGLAGPGGIDPLSPER
jgi:hypothetical protein